MGPVTTGSSLPECVPLSPRLQRGVSDRRPPRAQPGIQCRARPPWVSLAPLQEPNEWPRQWSQNRTGRGSFEGRGLEPREGRKRRGRYVAAPPPAPSPGWAAFGGILSGSEVHTGAAAAEPPPPHTSPSSSQGPWPGPFTQLTLQRMLPPPALLPGAALAYTELPCPGLTPPRGHPEASGWMMREYLSIWDNSKASSRPPGVLEPPVHELLP